MKYLNFEVKRNLRKPPRIYVKSCTTSVIYGSFAADAPDKFNGWGALNTNETIELTHYIDNLIAIKSCLGDDLLAEQADYRLRLPISFAKAVDEIALLCERDGIQCDIFTPLVFSIIQQLKISTAKLSNESKLKALAILDSFGLAEYKKVDYSQAINAVFSEIMAVHNKSEKLHEQAKRLFEKDKSYSPLSIQNMAEGETVPAKWLVCCAITLLLEEKPNVIKSIITEDNLFMLFAKQLLDNNREKELMGLVEKHDLTFLINRIKNYSPKQNER